MLHTEDVIAAAAASGKLYGISKSVRHDGACIVWKGMKVANDWCSLSQSLTHPHTKEINRKSAYVIVQEDNKLNSPSDGG